MHLCLLIGYTTVLCTTFIIVKRKYEIYPPFQETVVGETVHFKCSGENVKWTFEKEGLPLNAFIFKVSNGTFIHILEIHNVQLYNAGTYTCYRTFSNAYVEAGGILAVTSKQYLHYL